MKQGSHPLLEKCFRDQHLGILIRLQESPWPWRSRNPTPNRIVIPASGPYHNPNPLPRPKRQVVAVLSGVARFRPVSILVVQTWLKQVSQTDITKSLIRYSGFLAPYQLALLRCWSFLSRLSTLHRISPHFWPLRRLPRGVGTRTADRQTKEIFSDLEGEFEFGQQIYFLRKLFLPKIQNLGPHQANLAVFCTMIVKPSSPTRARYSVKLVSSPTNHEQGIWTR